MSPAEDRFAVRFALRPLEDITPWTDPDGGRSLSWYGLTDGWYWIEAGPHELFRYSDGEPVDYQVVRLWEDLLDVLPWALEPVPDDLFALAGDRSRLDAMRSGMQSFDDDWTAWHWFDLRVLSIFHLTVAPEIAFCRQADAMTVSWSHWGYDVEPDLRFSAPDEGTVVVAAADFEAAVRSFDRALLGAMEDRIDAVAAGALPAEIRVDLDHLRTEQHQRAQWFDQFRDCPRTAGDGGETWPTDWDLVRAAVAEAR